MNKSTYTDIILGTLTSYFLPAKKKEGIYSTLIIRYVSKDFGVYHQTRKIMVNVELRR